MMGNDAPPLPQNGHSHADLSMAGSTIASQSQTEMGPNTLTFVLTFYLFTVAPAWAEGRVVHTFALFLSASHRLPRTVVPPCTAQSPPDSWEPSAFVFSFGVMMVKLLLGDREKIKSTLI